MASGKRTPVRGFRLPEDIVSLEDIERVTMIYPVPYAGDEQPQVHIRRHMDEFMLTKPA